MEFMVREGLKATCDHVASVRAILYTSGFYSLDSVCHKALVFNERVACATCAEIKVANRGARRPDQVLRLKKRRWLAAQ
jgi:hypothetical protein